MRYYVLAAAVAAAISAPVSAQDAPFTGLRVEGLVGYERPSVESSAFDGVTYGVGAGYDFQLGGIVAGVEAELSDSSASECIGNFDVTGDKACFRTGRDIYAGARLGAAISPSMLLYAKAGYTNTRLNLEYDAGPTVVGGDFGGGENVDGLRAGAGAEFAIGSRSFLKTEYRYSNYENGYEKHQIVGGFGFRF
jgi:outer membrane immunogenic protein